MRTTRRWPVERQPRCRLERLEIKGNINMERTVNIGEDIVEDKEIGAEVKEMMGMLEVLGKAEEKEYATIVAFQDILRETAGSPKEEEKGLEEEKDMEERQKTDSVIVVERRVISRGTAREE